MPERRCLTVHCTEATFAQTCDLRGFHIRHGHVHSVFISKPDVIRTHELQVEHDSYRRRIREQDQNLVSMSR
jgi:hypothetical protein